MRGAVMIVLTLAACDRILGIEPGSPWPIDGMSGPLADSAVSDGAFGDGAPATSCEALSDGCGPMGNRSCCESPRVSGGTFYRGYDVAFDGMYPDMDAPATVSTFRLDRYEVTVGRFRRFVEAGMGTQENPPAPGSGARTLNGEADQGGWESRSEEHTSELQS